MLWTIAVILVVLWAPGLVTSYTMGGYIHVLLAIAVVVILINVLQGRKVLWRPGSTSLPVGRRFHFVRVVEGGIEGEETAWWDVSG
jgi:Family of unknown function (DUF5670)